MSPKSKWLPKLIPFLALALLAFGCGGGGGDGPGTTATISGRVAADPAARVAAKRLDAPVDVVAVDETGTMADEALGVTDGFALVVPTGHEYVLIFSDAGGIIGAMVYGEPHRADFSVEEGTIAIDLGEIVVNPSKRYVHATGQGLHRPDSAPGRDTDDDGIPDRLDDDDDNDGISDDDDICSRGDDCTLGPRDHDNDGIGDDMDDDDDDDGIADEDDDCRRGDDCSRDCDNDGEHDDRYQCDKRQSRGAELWADNGCADCHGADGSGGPEAPESIRGVNTNDIVHALKKGEENDGEGMDMPRYPDLVRYGVDFRAFLGCGDDDGDICAEGDAANGAVVFEACVGCHDAQDLRGESVAEIAEVLAEGEDDDGEIMPAFPELVDEAADIAAYIAGCPVEPAPVDTDGDGVEDDADLCPDTPAGAVVDQYGCPSDSDGDGVLDGIDQCPDTAADAAVDANGCSEEQLNADADGDGVVDASDQCPDTPADVVVDDQGCPVDADGDGVPDYLDTCADTPAGATVDANGCPSDSDGDGVLDGIDQCADTPMGTEVNAVGCPAQMPRPAVLDGLCLDCHDDRSGQFSCTSRGWLRHRNEIRSDVAAVYAEVSIWGTGGMCP